MIAYKCVRADGTDFRTGTFKYEIGSVLTVENPDSGETGSCGKGLHVSPTAKQTCQFGDRTKGPWRWFEVEINDSDVIARDSEKLRVRSLKVIRELNYVDVFSYDLKTNIDAMHAEVATWKNIPWLNTDHVVTEDEIKIHLAAWHDAVSPWLRKDKVLPRKGRIVRNIHVTAAAADAAATAAADADAAATAAADAAADAYDTAAYAYDAAADAAAYAYADAAADADAAATAADVTATAAYAAATAAYAAATAAYAAGAVRTLWPPGSWYRQPQYLLRQSARWKFAMSDKPNPFEPLINIMRLGCMPIGYVNQDFVVYCPDPSVTLK